MHICYNSVFNLHVPRYMVSAFFTRTTMAILFVLMVYLISYMPYILLIGLEVDMDFWEKRAAVSLLPDTVTLARVRTQQILFS